MKAEIDTAKCVGHGQCYATAPEVFEDDDDGYGRVLGNGQVAPADEEAAHRGAGNCPEAAITLSPDGS
jgi:ferredoxin